MSLTSTFGRLHIILFSLTLLFAVSASAQTSRPSANQDALDSALRDISTIYGSPVVRVDQAKAICNEEQYMIECAKIGQKYGLFSKERAAQVTVLLSEFKEKAVEQLKQCGTAECLVEVATSLANSLSANHPVLARTVGLTPQKVEEKRVIVEAAKSAGVDIGECQTMDPDTASLELLRSCAKLAKSESIQKFIPQEDRSNVEKSDATIALKEALAKGELSCGDGTIEGCGAFCLKPPSDARNGGASVIPPVCRQIAERFFGADGIQELERAHKNVREAFDVVSDRVSHPEGKRDDTATHRIICPEIALSPCRSGEYRQESFDESGCRIESACIPFNTKTQPTQETDKRVICPALPTVDSCAAGEEKLVSFSSPECGTYYSCKPVSKADTGTKYPYTFASGRVTLSFEEVRTYCYESGTGGATLKGDKAECERAFGISVPNIPPEKQCSQYGNGWHSMDDSGNCFNPSMTEYRTGSGGLQQCGNASVYGCSSNSGDYNNTYGGTPSGQKEQVCNSNGLRSWIRTDASSARIDSLKTACATVSGGGANVWMPGAGDPASQDFGMPSADKCSRASACTSAQYFNGSECVAGSGTSGSYNTSGTSGGDSGTYTAPVGQKEQVWNSNGLRSWIRTDAPSARIESLKTACAGVYGGGGNVWLPGSGDPSSTDFGMPDANKCQKASACTSAQYFNGSECASSGGYYGGASGGASGSCSSELIGLLGSGCHNMGSAWFNSGMTSYVMPGGSVVKSCTAEPISSCSGSGSGSGYGGSLNGGCPAGQYRDGSGACVTSPPSCTSGQYWNGTSCVTSSTQTGGGGGGNPCGAGQYWNNGACVATATTDCTAGQYWNGSSCVTSGTGTGTGSSADYAGAQAGCASAGGTWNSSSNYCQMPNSTYSGSGSPCGAGLYWNGSACVPSQTSSGGADYSAAQAGCASAGGTWNSSSNYCQMPTSYAGSKALAYACPEGHDWNGSYCTFRAGSLQSSVANALSAFSSFFGF